MQNIVKTDSLTETYQDVEKLIKHTCWRFYRTYGGDIEEWFSEANLIFMEADTLYNPKKGSYTHWIRFCIWKSLLNYKQKTDKHTHYTNTLSKNISNDSEEELEFQEQDTIHFFSPLEFLDGLKEDTKELINIIWESPQEFRDMGCKNGNNPCHVKTTLRTYLRNKKWSWKRIEQTFQEIEELINV